MARTPKKTYDSCSLSLRQKAWLAFVFLFPILAGEGTIFHWTDGYPFLFASSMAGLAMGGWSLCSPLRESRTRGRDLSFFLLPLFVLFSGLSLLWTVSHDHSACLFIPMAIGGVISLALDGEPLSPLFVRRLAATLVASSAVLALVAVYQTGELRWRMLFERPPVDVPMDLFLEHAEGFRANSLFKDANTFGSFLSIVFPLNLFLIMESNRRTWMILGIGALILNITGLFLVASRGPAILAFFALLAVLLYSSRRSSRGKGHCRRILLILGGLTVAGIGLQLLIKLSGGRSLLDRLLDFGEMGGGALPARFHYWTAATRAFLDHPWLGSGLNTLQQTIFPYLVEGTFTRFPHNIFLQFMAETGLPGGLLFIASVPAVLARGLHPFRITPESFYSSLAYLTLAAYAFFDITFQCTTVIFLFFLLAGVIRGMPAADESVPVPSPASSAGPRRFRNLLIILAAAAGLYAAFEAVRLFRVRVDINRACTLAETAPPFRVEAAFEEALERPHLLIHKAYAGWLTHLSETTGSAAALERAIEQYVRAYERGGGNPCEALMIGKACKKAERYDEAAAWFGRAVSGFPSNLTAWREYLELRILEGEEGEALERLPVLLLGMSRFPAMEKYHAIDRFELELMLAELYEKAGHAGQALEAYRNILHHYRGRSYLESIDPINSKLIRMPLHPRLEAVRQKTEALQPGHRGP